jgi:hypothetical protein
MALNRVRIITICACVLALSISAGCGNGEREGDRAMYTNVEMTLKKIDPDDIEKLETLAREIRERSLKDVQAVVRIFHSDNLDEAAKASVVLTALGDVAFSPLVESLPVDQRMLLVSDMHSLVEIQLANRVQIVAQLEKMLDDKTLLPIKEPPPHIEEKPLPRRVCDEAYLMMRSLFALEDAESAVFSESAFLEMTDEDRDSEIARVRSSGKWVSLIESGIEE